MRYLIAALIIISIASCTFQKLPNNKVLSISNLENFFYDYNDNLSYLTNHTLSSQKKVKSISIYRYSSGHQQYLLEDSIIFNTNGKPIMNFKRTDIHEYSLTHFFYDNFGNRYLDITVSSNKHDTTYVLRKFDKFNRICKEMDYNVSRKEYGRIFITNITPISDSQINMRYEFYESDLDHKNLLPFETRDIKVKILNDSVVQANINRLVQYDTTNNSSYTNLYRIRNNTLIPIDDKSTINTVTDSGCYEMKYNHCSIKRKFEFYSQKERDLQNEFPINKSIVQTLNIKIDSLPNVAWKLYKKKLIAFSERNKIMEGGINNDRIELNESSTIERFTPQLWHIVSQDSGYIQGIKNLCYVVGYNTPIKNEVGLNKRCLAIYEKSNGKFKLRKQSFGALEDFNDSDGDLLFNRFDETNFTVKIEDGKIAVDYSYMRGEASYVFSCAEEKWVLAYYGSSHRTCCQAESYSYDYITKKYSFSVFGIGEDTKGDTSYTVIQKRPVMYMDSINIRQFDYNETGLIVK